MKCLLKKRNLFNCSSIRKALIHRDVKAPEVKGPLDGVRICDMTRVLAGPYCTMVLADMGAEVIKIERKGIGDETRTWGLPSIDGESFYNLSINRNKKSVCVDIQKETGRDIVYELVKNSDVFIENFVFGKLDSLGLGYETLCDINPSLIYCSINGYGARGDDKTKPGYDLVASAIGGLLHVTGPMDGTPCRSGVALTDILTGMYAHTAIISALYERSYTNIGKKINVSLLQSQVAMLSYHASTYLNKGIDATRYGSGQSCVVPSQSFKTKDGEIVISATNDDTFKKLCKLIGCHELCLDDRFKDNTRRVENRSTLEKIICNYIRENSSEYWLSLLSEGGVPCGPIHDVNEAFGSPQVKALDTVHEVMHPLMGKVKVTGPGVTYDGKTFVTPPMPPPLLGEHTEEVISRVINADETV